MIRIYRVRRQWRDIISGGNRPYWFYLYGAWRPLSYFFPNLTTVSYQTSGEYLIGRLRVTTKPKFINVNCNNNTTTRATLFHHSFYFYCNCSFTVH